MSSVYHRPDPQPLEIFDPVTKCIDIVKEKPAEAIGVTFGIFVAQFLVSIVMQVIMFAGNMIASLIMRGLVEVNLTLAKLVGLGISLCIALVMMVVMIAVQSVTMGSLQILWLRLVRGQDANFGHLAEVKRFILPLIITNLLVGLATFAGTLALIIPGYIVAFGLVWASAVVLDHNVKGVEALKASWALTDGHKLNIFLLCLILGVLNFIGMLACGVGMFVTFPVTMGALLYYYNSVAKPGNAYMTPQEQNAFGAGHANPYMNHPMGGGGMGPM